MKNDCVAILMASYNGEKYISQQIESILNQSYTNWHLWTRDDCSSDDTENIIKNYIIKNSQIRIIENNGMRLGSCMNFGELVSHIISLDYQYIMFADQDDVWNSDKIEKSLFNIKKVEDAKGDNFPILLHTDFQYVDENLNNIRTKDNVARKLSRYKNKIRLIANDNYIFGCTVIVNKALLTLCHPVHESAQNYDYWMALHGAVFGTIIYIDEKTMLYRQHTKNITGGLKYSYWKNRLRRLANFEAYINLKHNALIQFQAFVEEKKTIFPAEELILFKKYIKYSKRGGILSILFMIKNNFKLRGFPQTFIYYISLLIDRKC
jgi:rhamnosyltransferase